MKLFTSKRHNFRSGAHLSADMRKLMLRFSTVSMIIVSLILLSSLLVWLIEGKGNESNTIRNMWDGIWWAIVTVTTVGYGDKYPVTPYGRIIGLTLIIAGFTSLSVFTGLIASMFVEDRLKGAKGLKQIKTHNHIVICGWNKTADVILKAMVDRNMMDIEIVLITNQTAEFFEGIESRFPNLCVKFVRGEPTSEEILRRASVNSASQVIILADQGLDHQNADDRTIIIANAIHYNAPKAKITVQLINGENRNLLLRIGIDNIMVCDEVGGYILADNILDGSSLTIYNQLARDPRSYLASIPIDQQFIGKTFGELYDQLNREKGVMVIGLMSKEPEIDLESVFTDNTSAIDQFIKSTLAPSKKLKTEDKHNFRWNPRQDSIIQENDHAVVLV